MSSSGSKNMWLDQLPFNVCHQIASNVSGEQQNIDALNLLCSSVFQGKAVMESLENTVTFGRTCKGYGSYLDPAKRYAKWAEHCSNEKLIGQLTKIKVDPLCLDVPKDLLGIVRKLLKAPNLKTLEAPMSKRLFKALLKSAITNLTISIDEKISRLQFWSALEKLPLKRLHVCCFSEDPDRCVFRPAFWRKKTLADVCPQITSLSILCSCDRGNHPLWKYMPELRLLTHIELEDAPVPPLHLLPTVRALDSVVIERSKYPLRTAIIIGAPVRKVYVGREIVLSKMELVALSMACPRLETAVWRVEKEATVVLPEVLRSFPELHSLGLWQGDIKSEVSNDDVLYGQDDETADLWLRVVQNAPKLTDLTLHMLHTNTKAMVGILKQLGSHLEHFHFSLCIPRKDRWDCLATMLETMYVYNRRLLKLSLMRFTNMKLCDYVSYEGALERCEKFLGKLIEVTPSLDATELQSTMAQALAQLHSQRSQGWAIESNVTWSFGAGE